MKQVQNRRLAFFKGYTDFVIGRKLKIHGPESIP
jgi:hypothetical protein